MVRTFKLKPWVYAGLLALSPLSANAAGLGKLTVTSALGQPLRAEMELVAVEPGELDSLSARIASADAYRDAKIERAGAILGVRFAVETKKDGSPVLKVTTLQPVNEPFLDMLVELNWAAGRLLREYTVLLDPPGYAAEPQAVQPVVVPTVKSATSAAPMEAAPLEPVPAPAARIEPVKPAKAGKKPVARAAEPKPAPAEPAPAEAAPGEAQPQPAGDTKSYGPVKKGDTLMGIASQLKPEGFSLEQMLVALYQNNKQAFSGNNMNRLKSGQILRVPEEQQLATLGRAEAAHEVRTHTADWNAYRQKLAGAVAEAPVPKEEAPKQIAKGKITAAVEDKAAPAPAPSKDVLKVTKGEAAASGKELQALQNKLQSLQEETTAKGKSLKEANERIASLEKSIKDMQQLIELKNKNLAELQKQAAAKPEPVAKPEPAPAPKPAEAPAKPVEPVAEKPAEPAKPAEAPKPVEEKPAEVAPTPAKPKPVAPPPPPEPSLLDSITGSPLTMAAGAGALALLGGGALFAINRRRRKSLSSFEDSILTGGDLKANTVFGETAGGVVDTGDTSFLTDFSQAGLGTIDTNDVDPIAEAEVYMAYGRDAQAEEILKEAMSKDPNRHEVHLKLLEIYAARKNLIAFETLAGELYAATGGKPSPLWDKAAEMGRALDPNNPLYGVTEGGAKSAPETVASAMLAEEPGVDLGMPTQGLMEADLGTEEVSTDLEFEVGEAPEFEAETLAEEAPAAPPVEAAPSEEEVSALEFDFGTIAEKPVAPAPEPEATPSFDEASGLEFDLDELMPAPEPAVSEPAPSAESPAFGAPREEPGQELDLDLDALAHPPEVKTATTPEFEATAESADLDFSLDFPETAPELEIPVAMPEPEISASPVLEAEGESIEISAAPLAEEEAHLDFNFDLGGEMAPAAAEPAKEPSALPELDLSGISLDLEETTAPQMLAEAPSDAGEGSSAEVATKLDLARAYVEMGDKDGAREILDEVLKEGNAQQQSDANELLAGL